MAATMRHQHAAEERGKIIAENMNTAMEVAMRGAVEQA
jgi:hypothetical protein